MPHPESPGGLEGRTRRILALRAWGPARLRSAAARWAVNVLALAGAALIIISAIIHLHLWDQGYSGIAVMGPLFLAQGVVSIPSVVVLGVFRRLGLLAAGTALMAGAVGLLLTSVQVGLFGFNDSLAAPYAGMSLVVEFTGRAGRRRGAHRRRPAAPARPGTRRRRSG